jgi:hypothetical protein
MTIAHNCRCFAVFLHGFATTATVLRSSCDLSDVVLATIHPGIVRRVDVMTSITSRHQIIVHGTSDVIRGVSGKI